MNALVTNARSASALAVIRSLGRKGILITGASDSKDDFPLFSRYCRKKILLTSDPRDHESRINELVEIVKANKYDVFLPLMSENALLELAKRKSEFEKYTRITLPSFEHLNILNNKASVAATLAELGLPHPKTYFIDSDSTLELVKKEAVFPVVVKSHRGEGARGIKLVIEPKELENSYHNVTKNYGPAIIQEFIHGTKHTAVFLLNNNSEVRRFFVHRAIREFPITGGPTCFLESVRYDPVFEVGLKLLRHINFSGLASMEFIVDKYDSKPKIIDINPRFYGPLQCAVSSGADMPFAYFNMVMNDDIETDLTYREGVTCRHLLFDDTKHMISVLKGSKSPKYNLGKISTLINYLNFFKDDSYFVLSISDPKPAIKKIFGQI
jgi:predicted ATP-grasp superfamily ATP-dependent carboligase